MSYNYLILRVLDRPHLDFACVGSLNLEGTGTETGTGIGLRPAACRQTETAPALRASAVSVCLQRNSKRIKAPAHDESNIIVAAAARTPGEFVSAARIRTSISSDDRGYTVYVNVDALCPGP